MPSSDDTSSKPAAAPKQVRPPYGCFGIVAGLFAILAGTNDAPGWCIVLSLAAIVLLIAQLPSEAKAKSAEPPKVPTAAEAVIEIARLPSEAQAVLGSILPAGITHLTPEQLHELTEIACQLGQDCRRLVTDHLASAKTGAAADLVAAMAELAREPGEGSHG
jgi:hypothetical protein